MVPLPSVPAFPPHFHSRSTSLGLIYWHSGQTGVRAAKYPNDNSPVNWESVSMKKPWFESKR